MIHVDISNIWGEISLRDLLALEKEIFDAHQAITDPAGPYAGHLGWMKLPDQTEADLQRILDAAQTIRERSDVCVVVGIGGSCLGSRAAIELLRNPIGNAGSGKKGDPLVLYAGSRLSSRHWLRLTQQLEGKDFSLIVASKSGTTLESAIAFRELRWLLERRFGTEEARERIYVITDPCSGPLRQMAEENDWKAFSVPPAVGGRYSVLSAAGLLPMAVAGVDITRLLKGAQDAREQMDLRSFENPAWLYAAVRNVMQRKGKSTEFLVCSEPGIRSLGQWWQHLFAESEGKKGNGLIPIVLEFPGQLHTVGQLLQDGKRCLFETMLRFDPPEVQHSIVSHVDNTDGLNDLAGKTLDELGALTMDAALAAHAEGNVPVITADCGSVCEETLGGLFWFMMLSCAISASAMGVNPFNQPGMEPYRRNLFQLLDRPLWEQPGT